MKKIRIANISIILILTGLMFYTKLPYFNFSLDQFFFSCKPPALLENKLWLSIFYLHVATGLLVLLLGAIYLFITTFRKELKGLSKTYHFLVLFIVSPTALFLIFFSGAVYWIGTSAYIRLFLMCFWFFVSTYFALKNINHFHKHQNWFIRSYAMALAGSITPRVYSVIFSLAFHLDSVTNVNITLWLSLFGNILFGEIIIYFYKKNKISA